MTKKGFADYQIGDYISYRFLAVMAVALPGGIYIKGRKLKPFFYFAGIFAPLLAVALILAIDRRLDAWLYPLLILWGAAFTCIQITALPFILLNARRDTHSEAIALFYQTWSLSTCIVGLGSAALNHFSSQLFDEKTLLLMFSSMGFVSLWFIHNIDVEERVSERKPLAMFRSGYDWGKILFALTPTLIIATGAGFTIPFINLFFYHVHGIDTATFSLLSAVSYMFVATGVLFIPAVKRAFGYKVAITMIQLLSVIALIGMVTTEFYASLPFAAAIAMMFYIIRQPLMNVAGPMSSELVMYYVGEKNQEIVSALTVAIWSGSWFISGQLFRMFRSMDLSYVNIFLITAGLYLIGIAWYYAIIKAYEHRSNNR